MRSGFNPTERPSTQAVALSGTSSGGRAPIYLWKATRVPHTFQVRTSAQEADQAVGLTFRKREIAMPRGRAFVYEYSFYEGVSDDTSLGHFDLDDWAVAQNQLTGQLKFLGLLPSGQLKEWDPSQVKTIRAFVTEIRVGSHSISRVAGWDIVRDRESLSVGEGLAPLACSTDPVEAAHGVFRRCSPCYEPDDTVAAAIRTVDFVFWTEHVCLQQDGHLVLELARKVGQSLGAGPICSKDTWTSISAIYDPDGSPPVSLVAPDDASDQDLSILKRLRARPDGKVTRSWF